MSKLFAVTFISADPLDASVQRRVEAAVLQEIANCDIVLLADFGHGLMQPGVRELVQEHGTLVAVSCQTNSYNHGFNIISRQYQRVDAFTLDERELVLSVGHPDLDFQKELAQLKLRLGARYAWLTRGALETIGLGPDDVPYSCPPLERNVVDTIGAGDAFFAVAALSAARGLPIELATFLSQLAGAQAVRIVGNSRPLSKDGLLQTAQYLLNATRRADMRWTNSP
jgi:sugar/nucleoside kinase (ribokinase family)